MKDNKEKIKFVWRIAAAHIIAYCIAGVFASKVFDYGNWFSSGLISAIMRPITAPIIALGGTSLQLFRGVIIALVLLPMRKVFTEEKHGFLKLGLLTFGLSVVSTFTAAIGSIEGLIYTKVPVMEQFIGYPEAIIWITLFIGIFWTFYKLEKKAINVIAVVLVILIVFFGIMGYLDALGYLLKNT